MIFAAVKLNCTYPSATEIVLTSERRVLAWGPEWLVYQVRMGQKGILLTYNDKTQRHEFAQGRRTK